QGICPSGWHLPSDYEWNQLEKEIATNPSPYADQTTPLAWNTSYESATGYRPGTGTTETYWGRQMKSQTAVSGATNGKSYTRANGGFDALLVGYMLSGSAYNYGTFTYFWSSSSSSGASAWSRYLYSSNSGAVRNYNSKSTLFSVRCKKND
ncbi:MAG: fibrobacter succinogenes major paralogous domain-containing protein, partial [Candidatus Symbiothrix sp.]|nr:fibrobacter succinogenes major paralogous domain-containing protein [Candidatus Symbiothrix sp.]